MLSEFHTRITNLNSRKFQYNNPRFVLWFYVNANLFDIGILVTTEIVVF